MSLVGSDQTHFNYPRSLFFSFSDFSCSYLPFQLQIFQTAQQLSASFCFQAELSEKYYRLICLFDCSCAFNLRFTYLYIRFPLVVLHSPILKLLFFRFSFLSSCQPQADLLNSFYILLVIQRILTYSSCWRTRKESRRVNPQTQLLFQKEILLLEELNSLLQSQSNSFLFISTDSIYSCKLVISIIYFLAFSSMYDGRSCSSTDSPSSLSRQMTQEIPWDLTSQPRLSIFLQRRMQSNLKALRSLTSFLALSQSSSMLDMLERNLFFLSLMKALRELSIFLRDQFSFWSQQSLFCLASSRSRMFDYSCLIHFQRILVQFQQYFEHSPIRTQFCLQLYFLICLKLSRTSLALKRLRVRLSSLLDFLSLALVILFHRSRLLTVSCSVFWSGLTQRFYQSNFQYISFRVNFNPSQDSTSFLTFSLQLATLFLFIFTYFLEYSDIQLQGLIRIYCFSFSRHSSLYIKRCFGNNIFLFILNYHSFSVFIRFRTENTRFYLDFQVESWIFDYSSANGFFQTKS